MVEKDWTVDHVVPRTKGGKTSWTNCTTSCMKCNSKKGDKNLWDTNLSLRTIPAKPSVSDLVKIKRQRIQEQLETMWDHLKC
jgi:5-methylcytosine-specific restriction endonuclease McrA